MNKVKVSAPGKLMLFGEHAVVYGKPCIVTAVGQRMRVIVEKVNGSPIELIAPEVDIKNFKADAFTPVDKLPKGAKFVFVSVANFYKKYGVASGLKIETKSDFSSKFGFGSSSAVSVAVIKTLTKLFDIQVDNKSLFDIAYKSVLDIQGVGSGFDIAAAVWGGTIYFVGGGKEIIPLKSKPLQIIVGYTGVKADTATLVKQVANLYESDRKQVEEVFTSIENIVEDARAALNKESWKELGRLANLNQSCLEKIGVNTPELSRLIIAARGAGAFGAKLSGAGGGDCMFAIVNNKIKLKVEEAITSAGGTVLGVKLNAEGVKLEL